jgi:Icc-related predicted phosphoesterase
MRILVVSDLHGDLASARQAVERFEPEVLLSCGDWGDPDQVAIDELESFPATLPLLTTFGNHDPLAWLDRLRNRDGSTVLLAQGEVREIGGLRVGAIGGIWAKSHRLPHYVTDEDVAAFAQRVVETGPVDVLLTHGCPIGLADLTPKGTHGGQRCFLDAWRTIAPRVLFCGHLHVAQERSFAHGRQVINVGATPDGSVALIESDGRDLTCRLERFRDSPPSRSRGSRPLT